MLSQERSPADAPSGQLSAVPVERARETNRLRAGALVDYEVDLAACAMDMAERFHSGGTLLACGDGGCAAAASDIVTRLMAPTAGRSPLPALWLTADLSVVTDEITFDDVFLRQIIALGRPDDIAVGISTSGNSENILRAMREAAYRGMLTVGLCGGAGGAMATDPALAYRFAVESTSVHRTREVQATLYGVLCDLVHHKMET